MFSARHRRFVFEEQKHFECGTSLPFCRNEQLAAIRLLFFLNAKYALKIPGMRKVRRLKSDIPPLWQLETS